MRLKQYIIACFALALPLGAFAQIPTNVPTAGLVGWWPFNGNAANESGVGANGTVHGATLSADRFGTAAKAYTFNGTTDYIEIPNYAAMNIKTGTLNLWLKTSKQGYQQVVKKNAYVGAVNEHLSLGLSPQAYFGVKRNSNCQHGGFQTLWGTGTVANGTWHMVTAAFDAASIRIYVDSILVDVLASTSAVSDTCPGDLLFGINWDNDKLPFTGVLDDIGLWNRALSQQEISLLYAGCTTSITTQPANASVQAGAAASFAVGINDPQATYQWQVQSGSGSFQNLTNTAPYSGTTTATLAVNPAFAALNTYTYRCLIGSKGCSFTSGSAKLTVTTAPPNGVRPPGGSAGLALYPNPATDQLTLDVPGATGTVAVYSVDGRLLLRQPLDASKTLRTADLPAGSYVLQLVAAEAVRTAHFTIVR